MSEDAAALFALSAGQSLLFLTGVTFTEWLACVTGNTRVKSFSRTRSADCAPRCTG